MVQSSKRSLIALSWGWLLNEKSKRKERENGKRTKPKANH